MSIREFIKNLLDVLVRSEFGILPDFLVEVPENKEHGDYFTNAALILAKSLQRSPGEVAKEIKNALSGQLGGWKVEIAGPGFINFWISEDCLLEEFRKIIKEDRNYGRGKKQKTRLQIEYVSANPTGPLTLANGRGGFLGDTLSNILEFYGFTVEREYYVNDTGNQIMTLGKSILAAAGVISEEDSFYKGVYIKKWARDNRSKVKRFKKDSLKLGQEAAKYFLADIKKNLKTGGINFDRFTSEYKNVHKGGLVKKTIEALEKSGLVYKNEGAVWLKTTNFGDDKDRVLLTSDGFPTYFLADAGHYLETKTRKFDGKINILGPDHFGYVKRIKAAAELLGFDNAGFIITQTVRIVRDGIEVKMSKRAGEFITFADLLKKVGPDVARYFFLEKSADTHIDFDIMLAREKSAKNPVYYIQYAHARISSIFRKAQIAKRKILQADLKRLKEIEELQLLKKLIEFPEIIKDTAGDYQVHRLLRFSLELAGLFHNFYEKHRIITVEPQLTAARLNLALGTKIVLKNILDLIGIASPRRM